MAHWSGSFSDRLPLLSRKLLHFTAQSLTLSRLPPFSGPLIYRSSPWSVMLKFATSFVCPLGPGQKVKVTLVRWTPGNANVTQRMYTSAIVKLLVHGKNQNATGWPQRAISPCQSISVPFAAIFLLVK